MELSELREKIDVLDDEMQKLFAERMTLSREIAHCKAEKSLPVLNKSREREILARVCGQSGEFKQYSHRLFLTLFELGRAYQDTLGTYRSDVKEKVEAALRKAPEPFPQAGTVACQGVEGSYSQMAAERMFPRGNITFFKTFEAVFEAVKSGFCEFGILPIENSSGGSVRAVYDLLCRKDVNIVRSERLCIRHELLAKPGTGLSDVREIHSHPQALDQCGNFLKKLKDGVRIIPCENTASAAEHAALSEDSGVAAIASHSCGKLYGLAPVETDIQDSDNNYTRFICITKDPAIYPGADRVSLVLACEHRPGGLYEILAKMAALEVNLLKLESRPIVGSDFEFSFFFELQASCADPAILSMLESLEQSCEDFVFLGNYQEF
ncbi:MAG: bifunctional chorismate mutase/prephenate dehydratase [Clostridia bacterium]|nr:bifunctional chorismate mutase/prephenate dehydratase [Clostridia bacterium]